MPVFALADRSRARHAMAAHENFPVGRQPHFLRRRLGHLRDARRAGRAFREPVAVALDEDHAGEQHRIEIVGLRGALDDGPEFGLEDSRRRLQRIGEAQQIKIEIGFEKVRTRGDELRREALSGLAEPFDVRKAIGTSAGRPARGN